MRSATGSWRAILRAELPQVARIVVAAAAAWEAALLLGATQPPIFAALVPLVSLRDDPFSAFNLSVARLVGVVAGLLIAIGVLAVLEPTTLAIAAVLALALLVGLVLRIGNVLNTQVAVSALLVFSSTDTAGYAVTRLLGDRPRHGGHGGARALPVPRQPAHRGPRRARAGGGGPGRGPADVDGPRGARRRRRPARRPAAGDRRHRGRLRLEFLEPLVEPLERAVIAALTGRPYAEDLERARAAVEQFRGVDHSGMASVVRRPLHRMVDDLTAFRP